MIKLAERRRHWIAGRRAEWLAVWLLRLKGYQILARDRQSHRGSGLGEIDLIARRGSTLVILEVKYRTTLAAAAASIAPRQKQRLIRAATAFQAGRSDLAALTLRFDAMLIAPGCWPRHVIDAWRAEG